MWTRAVMRPGWARLASRACGARRLCTGAQASPQQRAKESFPRESYQLVSQEAAPDQQPAPPRTMDERLPEPDVPAPVHGVRHLESLLQRGEESVHPAHFGRVLSAALAQSDYAQAEAAYALVEQHLTTPDVAILTAALQIYARNGAPAPGMDVLERMRAADLRPDAASLGSFLGALCQAQEAEKANQVVQMIPAFRLDVERQEVLQSLLAGLGRSSSPEDKALRQQVSRAIVEWAQHPDQSPPSLSLPPRQEDQVITSPPKKDNKDEKDKANKDQEKDGEKKDSSSPTSSA